ncbi:MAG: creatininase family protein [Lentisphaeria bacterium]|nr:creatininase family protein [Lentisphaeria bacterium]
MRYELMRPAHIERAIDENWPVILPLGVLEYHGGHLPVGMDTLVVIHCAELLEKEMDIVILPPFYYGSGSYAVEPPERKGTVQVDSRQLVPFARDLFNSLIRIGFKNIHFFIHHQSENFAAGMPTDLSFRLAARQVIFDYLEGEGGKEGWWGDPSMANYYEQHDAGTDPFNWIKGHPLMDDEILAKFPFDHAGQGETSLMMALCPETVDMEAFDETRWYAQSAKEASRELGLQGVEMILAHMRRVLA